VGSVESSKIASLEERSTWTIIESMLITHRGLRCLHTSLQALAAAKHLDCMLATSNAATLKAAGLELRGASSPTTSDIGTLQEGSTLRSLSFDIVAGMRQGDAGEARHGSDKGRSELDHCRGSDEGDAKRERW
jgi:hypothetical protein